MELHHVMCLTCRRIIVGTPLALFLAIAVAGWPLVRFFVLRPNPSKDYGAELLKLVP